MCIPTFLGFNREDIRRLMSPEFSDPLDIVDVARHVVNSQAMQRGKKRVLHDVTKLFRST